MPRVAFLHGALRLSGTGVKLPADSRLLHPFSSELNLTPHSSFNFGTGCVSPSGWALPWCAPCEPGRQSVPNSGNHTSSSPPTSSSVLARTSQSLPEDRLQLDLLEVTPSPVEVSVPISNPYLVLLTLTHWCRFGAVSLTFLQDDFHLHFHLVLLEDTVPAVSPLHTLALHSLWLIHPCSFCTGSIIFPDNPCLLLDSAHCTLTRDHFPFFSNKHSLHHPLFFLVF